MAKQTPRVVSPTKTKSRLNDSVEALAPHLTLAQAHGLFEALARSPRLSAGSDDEEETPPLGPGQRAA